MSLHLGCIPNPRSLQHGTEIYPEFFTPLMCSTPFFIHQFFHGIIFFFQRDPNPPNHFKRKTFGPKKTWSILFHDGFLSFFFGDFCSMIRWKFSTLAPWDIKVSKARQDAALWLARSAQEGLRSSVMGHLQGAKVNKKRVGSNGSRMIPSLKLTWYLKMGLPKRQRSYSNHSFSGAILVSGGYWSLLFIVHVVLMICLLDVARSSY